MIQMRIWIQMKMKNQNYIIYLLKLKKVFKKGDEKSKEIFSQENIEKIKKKYIVILQEWENLIKREEVDVL